jgi:hypothetical protein
MLFVIGLEEIFCMVWFTHHMKKNVERQVLFIYAMPLPGAMGAD